MPIFEVQGSDGKTYEVEAASPEEATKAFAPQQEAPQFPERTIAGAAWEGLTNVPGQAARVAGALGEGAYTAVTDPVKASKAVGDFALNSLGAASGGVMNIPAGANNLIEMAGGSRVLPEINFDPNSLAGRQQEMASRVGQGLKDRYGGYQNLLNTLATDPLGSLLDVGTLPLGGEGIAARMGASAGLVSKLGKAGEALNLPAHAANTVLKGGTKVAEKIKNYKNLVDAAKDLQVSNRTMTNLGEAVGTPSKARDLQNIVGPEVALSGLSPTATQEARSIAAVQSSSPARKGLIDMAQSQVEASSDRFARDWKQTIGVGQSKYDKELANAVERNKASNIYEVAKKTKIDINPVLDTFIDAYSKNLNDITGLVTLNKERKYITNPLNGNIIDSAEELLNLRKSIDEKITTIGKSQTNTIGASLFEQGSKTQQARPLMSIRKTINETLHKDHNFAEADRIFSSAEDAKAAHELGYSHVIGSGKNFMEPERLKARFDAMTVEEKAAFQRGLAQRGEALHGDIKGNRNVGKSAADTLNTENNLARIDAVTPNGTSKRLSDMAAREDAIAGSSNKILGGSDTARTTEAAAKYKKAPLIGVLNALGVAGLGISPLTASQHPILATLLGTLGIGAASVRTARNMSKAKMLDQTAKQLTKTGPEATSVLDAIDKSHIKSSLTAPKLTKKQALGLVGVLQAQRQFGGPR